MLAVLDASITLGWCLHSDGEGDSARIMRILCAGSAVAPGIWPAEVANGILVSARRGLASDSECDRLLELVRDLPVAIDRADTTRVLTIIAPLARAAGLTVYDAEYRELARRMGLPLATRDEAMRRAATSIGVELFRAD